MRKLQQVIPAVAARDGDGVNIHRLSGRRLHQILNPFLMIDEINSDNAADYIGGFPEHPHRGFETITYMKAGRMRHRDHMGNEGVIAAGDVQWMTAGSGVLHSEIPEQQEGLLHGFQIWLNLPASEKMQPAQYREIRSNRIQKQPLQCGGLISVIAGEVTVNNRILQGARKSASTQPVLLDITLPPQQYLELSFNPDYAAQIYVYRGNTDFIRSQQMGVYSQGETLELTAGSSGVELLVLSGRPITEPIVQYGPFVMNSSEQIEQAIRDFQSEDFIRSL